MTEVGHKSHVASLLNTVVGGELASDGFVHMVADDRDMCNCDVRGIGGEQVLEDSKICALWVDVEEVDVADELFTQERAEKQRTLVCPVQWLMRALPRLD